MTGIIQGLLAILGFNSNITANQSSIDEGQTVSFTVTTTNFGNGILYWNVETVSGTINSSDLTTSGSVSITNNSGLISIAITADATTEGSESFRVRLYSDSAMTTLIATSGTVTINDTSLSLIVTYNITANQSSINEGQIASFTVTTTNFGNGTLYWNVETVSGTINSSDLTTSGSVSITNNSGSISIAITADLITEGSESFRVRLYSDSARTTLVATSGTVTINDVSTLIIGAAYQGGYFAGQISTAGNGVATHNLIVAPISSGQIGSIPWKTSNTSTAGTSSVIDGPTNSANMNNAEHPGAQFCEALSIGGYTDWYMPAKDELEVCYYNLKPGTWTNNNTSSGINTYAVPSRSSNYTTGTPPQTSVTDFRSGGSQAFSETYYYSSTEGDATKAWMQWFWSGWQNSAYVKTTTALGGGAYALTVRAVRRVPV
jgi:hypothetical protein